MRFYTAILLFIGFLLVLGYRESVNYKTQRTYTPPPKEFQEEFRKYYNEHNVFDHPTTKEE